MHHSDWWWVCSIEFAIEFSRIRELADEFTYYNKVWLRTKNTFVLRHSDFAALIPSYVTSSFMIYEGAQSISLLLRTHLNEKVWEGTKIVGKFSVLATNASILTKMKSSSQDNYVRVQAKSWT